MMDKEEVFEKIKRISEAINKGEVEGAYEKIKDILTESPNELSVKSNLAGIIIDLGNIQGKLDYVEEGISLIKETFQEHKDLDYSTVSVLTYNLSNGYYSKYLILHKADKGTKAIKANNEAKTLLQNLILNKSKITRELHQQVIANYANCLDHIGRNIEAIDQYYDCLKLFPYHGLAMVNCGYAIENIISASGKHQVKNLFEAWNLQNCACANEERLLRYTNRSILSNIKTHLEKFEDQIGKTFDKGLDDLKEYQKHRKEVHGVPKVVPWIEQINNDRLLLTLNLNPLNSIEECVDDIFFQNLATEPGDLGINRFTKLANIINNIKEDFATSRYLYYESYKNEKIAKIGQMTKYANSLNYAQFGLSSGLLKASFKLAVDCLDKIATLLSEYFEFGNEDKNISFNNFWFIDCEYKKGINPLIEKRINENRYLGALKNLQEDWFLQEFPGPLKNIRDDATHRRFTLYWRLTASNEDKNIRSYSYDEFREITFFLLRMVKAAIIYSLITIDIEENEKPIKDFKIPMTFEYGPGITEQDYNFGNTDAE